MRGGVRGGVREKGGERGGVSGVIKQYRERMSKTTEFICRF